MGPLQHSFLPIPSSRAASGHEVPVSAPLVVLLLDLGFFFFVFRRPAGAAAARAACTPLTVSTRRRTRPKLSQRHAFSRQNSANTSSRSILNAAATFAGSQPAAATLFLAASSAASSRWPSSNVALSP